MNCTHLLLPSLTFCIANFISIFSGLPACAQIIPDNSLGDENSVVTPDQTIRGIESDLIEGGAVRGGNLFHSFQEFNIDAGRGAYFSNPEGISNILSRVTGENASNLLGTLGILGDANLFFINPNGILFGPEARLDVGGSFFASTADGILFENGFEFAASNPEAPPLLTVNMPVGLNIRENLGMITNQSIAFDSERNLSGLQVTSGKTLGLVGGEIQLERSFLTAPQGRIELGSVDGNNIVRLIPIAKGYTLNYDNTENFRDISLTSASIGVGNGKGDIQIHGRRVLLADGSVIDASTRGSEPGGTVLIQASESVEAIDSGSNIFVNVGPNATANGGSLTIITQRLSIQDGAQIATGVFGRGNGGNLTVNATDVEVLGTSESGRVSSTLNTSVQERGMGQAGNLAINTQNLQIRDGAQIFTGTFGNGDGGDLIINAANIEVIGTSLDDKASSTLSTGVGEGGTGQAGDLTINTQNLQIRDGAQVLAGTSGNGNAGDLKITATDIEVIDIFSMLTTSVASNGIGQGGNLIIDTHNLRVRDGGQIGSGVFGDGDAGDLKITATNIELIGTNVNGQAASILAASTEATTQGRGGSLIINAENLIVRDGAQIIAPTFGNGDAGDLKITAAHIELVGTATNDSQTSSALATTVERDATGRGGSLTIDAQNLIVRDGAQINASTFGGGDSGEITVNAVNVALIDTSPDGQTPSGIGTSVALDSVGNASNLTINTQNLQVREGAKITTETSGNGDAGDLTITGIDIELIGTSTDGQNNSGLFADANSESVGQGGELRVNADNLTIRDGARIDVRSEGTEAAGDLIINAPNILLDNQATLSGETTAGQGDIILNTQDLRLRNNSNITTNATGEAIGGNIEIDTTTLTALENSDISANAQAAEGGRIIINADGIFGTAFRDQQTLGSDITATSELGPEFSGTVELNIEIDPSAGLIELAPDVVDPNALIAQDPCRQGQDSEFFVTGRGGIAPDPTQTLTAIEGIVEWESAISGQPSVISGQQSGVSEQQAVETSRTNDKGQMTNDQEQTTSNSVTPARGWIRNEKGEVILVSYDPTQNGTIRQQYNPSFCNPL